MQAAAGLGRSLARGVIKCVLRFQKGKNLKVCFIYLEQRKYKSTNNAFVRKNAIIKLVWCHAF